MVSSATVFPLGASVPDEATVTVAFDVGVGVDSSAEVTFATLSNGPLSSGARSFASTVSVCDAPAASDANVQVTVPPELMPPFDAPVNATCGGSASVTVTAVACAVPELTTVSV